MISLSRILSSATELDLLKLGERFSIGPPTRSALSVLQSLLRGGVQVPLPALLDTLSEDALTLIAGREGLSVTGGRAGLRSSILAAAGGDDDETDAVIGLSVPRRQPRLAWQGMHRRAGTAAVPTQVVEVVSPGRAERREAEIPGLAVTSTRRQPNEIPENRLIWTNDNLVALRTLLEERDPQTGDWRYRGKVDLVYIDPPFMVNSDFRADNAIDLSISKSVTVSKEPSLVEILAYKDTWREGLDSFLSMIRARLLLLKELLKPTGSIYVHLDWHAAHYVKVLMDDLFGYENFRNQIVWQRTNARSAAGMWPRISDLILFYAASEATPLEPIFAPGDASTMPHTLITGADGQKYQTYELTAPEVRRGATGLPWRGFDPNEMGRHWGTDPSVMDELDRKGLIHWPGRGGWPRRRAEEPFDLSTRVVPVSDLWTDVDRINQAAGERLGYPTQKPVALLERILSASCPPGGLVLDCFLGSGTTAEAAERLGRRWIGIDISKYAIHVTRKRLIRLHDQPRPPAKELHDYVECETCKNIERKPRRQKSPGLFKVKSFTLENMGVYQRAEAWQDIQTGGSRYREELVAVFGGEAVSGYRLLHGRKGGAWVHVGPLDGPVASRQIWAIAREAAGTDTRELTILSADFNTLNADERRQIEDDLGVRVTVRIIPATAIEEVARRLRRQRGEGESVESMAIPAFYAPLAINLSARADGRLVRVRLERCEVDVESFIASQRPLLKPDTAAMSPAARKKAEAERSKWAAREADLRAWLARADSWRSFVDFWAVDWDYGDHLDGDGRPIFDTDWQSFRTRGKGDTTELILEAETRFQAPGRYRVAARVTDVFGNDGVSAVDVEVR